jgi:hypothetical protein
MQSKLSPTAPTFLLVVIIAIPRLPGTLVLLGGVLYTAKLCPPYNFLKNQLFTWTCKRDIVGQKEKVTRKGTLVFLHTECFQGLLARDNVDPRRVILVLLLDIPVCG